MDAFRSAASPSPSPHTHILRPRRSFQRTPFTSKANLLSSTGLLGGGPREGQDKLQSPVKLGDGTPDPQQQQQERLPARGRGRGSAAVLFPPSPDLASVPASPSRCATSPVSFPASPAATAAAGPATASPAPAPTRGSTRPGQREVASLKRLANAFGGAVLGKTRSSTARKAFDLNDWNHDLAAIASHPSSSTPTSPPVQGAQLAGESPSVPRRRSSRANMRAEMSSPVAEVASPRITRPRPGSGGSATSDKARPSGGEIGRRRKSDELDDVQLDSPPAAPSGPLDGNPTTSTILSTRTVTPSAARIRSPTHILCARPARSRLKPVTAFRVRCHLSRHLRPPTSRTRPRQSTLTRTLVSTSRPCRPPRSASRSIGLPR
jgi:hypothetical protein